MNKVIFLIVCFLITLPTNAEILTFTYVDGIVESGIINGVDQTGLSIDQVEIEISDGLTFSGGQILTGGNSGDFISLSVTIGGTVFLADAGSFQDGFRVDTAGLFNALNDPAVFRFLGLDNNEIINAQDGDTLREHFARNGNSYTVDQDGLILTAGTMTFNGGLTIDATINGTVGALVTLDAAVPEPSAYILLCFLGLGIFIRQKNASKKVYGQEE
ncbi:PEP-CTERM sorting domain-containing protein [Candidatus Uabimicrobium sp. HlEnr_7]|uniref:PEP-CTERM sorting domain-containing protein n=1 Tax=Candidatus Uabimicrobium helgolandensis TaxID=3095367 RepID=UPI003558B25F